MKMLIHTTSFASMSDWPMIGFEKSAAGKRRKDPGLKVRVSGDCLGAVHIEALRELSQIPSRYIGALSPRPFDRRCGSVPLDALVFTE
jgi:hypothetical protein